MVRPQGYSAAAVAHAVVLSKYGPLRTKVSRRVSDLVVTWWSLHGIRLSQVCSRDRCILDAKSFVRVNYHPPGLMERIIMPAALKTVVPQIVDWLLDDPDWAEQVAEHNL